MARLTQQAVEAPGVAQQTNPASVAFRLSPARVSEWARTGEAQTVLWSIAIFAASFVILTLSNLLVIKHLPPGGDEPWYLLQGYSILHYHTVDLTSALRNHEVYKSFLGIAPDDHTGIRCIMGQECFRISRAMRRWLPSRTSCVAVWVFWSCKRRLER